MTATHPVPSEAEVDLARQSIDERSKSLEVAYEKATDELEARIAERERAESDYRRKGVVNKKATDQLAGVLREIQRIRMRAVIHAMDESDLALNEFGALAPLEQKRTALSAVVEDLASFFLPEAREQILACQLAEAGAEADQLERIVELRNWNLELELQCLTTLEGDVVLDRNFGATADITRQAAQVRLRAEYLRNELSQMQRNRAGRANV